MNLSDDEHLIERFINGEREAFNSIFNKYYNLIRVYCRKFISDSQVAQEITGDTLNKLFKRHKDFTTIPALRSFLYKVSRNQCYDYLRQKERDTQKMNHFLTTYDWKQETLDDELDGEFIYQLVAEAMKELPKQTRSIIEMFYTDGLKYREIAERMNISIKTVESQKAAGLRMLQKIVASKYKMVAMSLIQVYLISAEHHEYFVPHFN